MTYIDGLQMEGGGIACCKETSGACAARSQTYSHVDIYKAHSSADRITLRPFLASSRKYSPKVLLRRS